jgi:hypothetical protein
MKLTSISDYRAKLIDKSRAYCGPLVDYQSVKYGMAVIRPEF